MMIVTINRRLHLYLTALIYQLRLWWAIRQCKRWARRTQEISLVLLIDKDGKRTPRAVRWSKIPKEVRSRCMRRSLYVAYPNGRKR